MGYYGVEQASGYAYPLLPQAYMSIAIKEKKYKHGNSNGDEAYSAYSRTSFCWQYL
jgi:hypothetical protein